jgi:hypothetical protein
MVDLPSYTPKGITAEAPTPGITPGAIEAVGSWHAQGLNALGKGLEDLSVPLAEEAGRQAVQKAVTRNPDGSINVDTPATSFILGKAGEHYAQTVEAGTIANLQTKISQDMAGLHQKFAGDPDGFRKAAGDYTDAWEGKFDGKTGLAVKNLSENYATQHYDTLVNNKASLDLQRNVSSIDTGIKSAQSDLMTLARQGVTSGPQWDVLNNQVDSLTAAKTANPRLAYPKETADYDRQTFRSELGAQGFLYHIDQVYKGQGGEDGGNATTRAARALDAAKSILTDESIKLTPEKREAYYHRAVGEIRANEAIRKQDVYEARSALSDLNMQSATGQPIAPEMVEGLAQQFRQAGDPGGAARVYAMFARKPLNDDFGRQPLDAQTRQLTATGSVADAIHMQESGGRPTAATSVTGATGGWQIQPETFKRYALPGESIANPADNERVGRRIIDDLSRKTGGDPARIAVGYFSGEGNIAPAGSKTPYIRDAADPTGKTTSSYVADVLGRLNGVGPAGTPAGALWLQTNHARTLQKAARESWGTVVSDYNKTGIMPSEQTVNTVVNAARATNDHDLLEGIAQWSDQIGLAQGLSQRPLPEQHAAITGAEAAGREGALSPGQGAVLKDLQRKNEAITTGLKENPVATTVKNFPDKFGTPAPLDLKNPDNLVAGLQQRGRIAQFAAQNWQTKPVSALDASDMQQVQAALDTPDPAIKGQIFQAIGTLPEDVRNATLAKIGAKRPDFMVSAAAGSLMRQAPDVAQSIFRGQEAIKADKGYLPTGTDAKSFVDKMDEHLPAAAFSLAGRTTDNGPFQVARGMVKARYADLSAQAADTTGKVNEDRVKQAVDDVTGGILNHNGGKFIAPRRGMGQRDFDVMMNGVHDGDLAGVTDLSGNPISADYLRGSAQLESIGQGRYQVRLGKEPMRPIYAYQNANTEAPQKFVLDLRNRQSVANAPLTGREVVTAGNYGGYVQ